MIPFGFFREISAGASVGGSCCCGAWSVSPLLVLCLYLPGSETGDHVVVVNLVGFAHLLPQAVVIT